MPTLSPARAQVPVLDGIKLVHRGKVRDTYELPGNDLLVVPTDGISIFDFVLNALIPEKGYVLNALSHFWFTMLERNGLKTHMLAAGSDIDAYLPPPLRNNADLMRRAMVVTRLDMASVEFIGRFCLTGSVLKEYRETGSVYGIRLKKGLQDGDKLSRILFTPTTKADEGHDLPMSREGVLKYFGKESKLFLKALRIVGAYAEKRGIVLADSKGEIGTAKDGSILIGDEFGTPDSSRFWDAVAWRRSREAKERKAPPPFDKQLVRAYGIEHGINVLDPTRHEDIVRAHALTLPQPLAEATRKTYRYIFWRLTGLTLEEYASKRLGVPTNPKKYKVAVVFGSESDIPEVIDLVKHVSGWDPENRVARMSVHVISCHRNPEELRRFTDSGCGGADVVVAAGGKAFALPGVLDALLAERGKNIPVIGVALGKRGSRSEKAARLSIEELPGEPVVLDTDGRAYRGREGFLRALLRIGESELPPPPNRAKRKALLDVDLSKYQ